MRRSPSTTPQVREPITSDWSEPTQQTVLAQEPRAGTSPSGSTGTGRSLHHAVSVVVVTRDRRDSLLETLGHLERLPERPLTVVVDNGSRDGTVAAVLAEYPEVEVIALPENQGGAARTV